MQIIVDNNNWNDNCLHIIRALPVLEHQAVRIRRDEIPNARHASERSAKQSQLESKHHQPSRQEMGKECRRQRKPVPLKRYCRREGGGIIERVKGIREISNTSPAHSLLNNIAITFHTMKQANEKSLHLPGVHPGHVARVCEFDCDPHVRNLRAQSCAIKMPERSATTNSSKDERTMTSDETHSKSHLVHVSHCIVLKADALPG